MYSFTAVPNEFPNQEGPCPLHPVLKLLVAYLQQMRIMGMDLSFHVHVQSFEILLICEKAILVFS